jgi:NAD(P)-dependent dehydrogenase (short-subunit alcohol dehydrogenase family)
MALFYRLSRPASNAITSAAYDSAETEVTMESFAGKTAVVTGGGSGIGRGLCLAFAREGANVVVADIEQDAAESVAAEARESGVRAIAVRTDVADAASVAQLADRAYAEFGDVNVLCNNAGVLVFKWFGDTTEADWDWVLAVNLKGVVNGLLAFLPRMRASTGERHIVNTASMAGLVGFSQLPLAAYTTSKFAVVGLSEALRGEVAKDGIGVSVLCPGGVRTRIAQADRNRQEAFGGPSAPALPEMGGGSGGFVGLEPEAVADLVLAGIRANRLYIQTHPENEGPIDQRMKDLLGSFEAVR